MALAAPTNLTAEVLSATQVLLTWTEVAGATYHRVYKDGAIAAIANSSWVDNAFDPDAVTTYEVRAVQVAFGEDLELQISPILTVGPAATLVLGDDDGETDVPTPPTTLAVPQGLAAEQTNLGEVTLTWELLTPATHIDVEIDAAVTRIPADVTYTETGITAGTTREYRIRAVNTAADPEVVSDYTDLVEITVVTLGIPDPNVTVGSSTRIIVDWAAVPGATAYDAEIDGVVTNLDDFPGFLDSGLAPTQTRTYRVRARAGSTIGDWSAEVTGTTFRTVPIVIQGVLRRLSYFPSDSRITARAVEAEFNNIYALMAGGTLTENTSDPDNDPLEPLPDPVPPPVVPGPPPTDPDPPAPGPSPTPDPPANFPPAPSGGDPARPAGWTQDTTPLASNPATVATSWVDFFGAPFPYGNARDLAIESDKYVALSFNTGTLESRGQIAFSDLSGSIAGVGTRPALVTISPYAGDFRLSLGAPYYRLIGVGGAYPAYAWSRTEGDPFRAYLPPNTDLYFNIAYVSSASQGSAADSLVWQCTATNPDDCGHRLQILTG